MHSRGSFNIFVLPSQIPNRNTTYFSLRINKEINFSNVRLKN